MLLFVVVAYFRIVPTAPEPDEQTRNTYRKKKHRTRKRAGNYTSNSSDEKSQGYDTQLQFSFLRSLPASWNASITAALSARRRAIVAGSVVF